MNDNPKHNLSEEDAKALSDATREKKGAVRLSGDLSGTAENPKVPALDEIEELRAKRAEQLEDKLKSTAEVATTDREDLAAELERVREERAVDATATREELAAELERLREETRTRLEARRAEIAAEVETARILAEGNARIQREEMAAQIETSRAATEVTARDAREKLADRVEKDRNVESARVDWRLNGHDNDFAELNALVAECALGIKEQTIITGALRDEMRTHFIESERTALNRELAAAKAAKDADTEAKRLALAAKADSRKMLFQFAGVILTALIAAFGAIIVAVL